MLLDFFFFSSKHNPEKWPRWWAVQALQSWQTQQDTEKQEKAREGFIYKQFSNTKQDDRNELEYTSNHNK